MCTRIHPPIRITDYPASRAQAASLAESQSIEPLSESFGFRNCRIPARRSGSFAVPFGDLGYTFSAMKYLTLAVLLTVMQAPPPVPRKTANQSAGTSSHVQQQPDPEKAPAAGTQSTAYVNAASNDATAPEKKTGNNAEQTINVGKLPAVTVSGPDRNWADWLLWGSNVLLVPITFIIAITAVIQASAARLNAQALIHSERPWIMPQVEILPGKNSANSLFRIDAFNYGKSPGHIVACDGPIAEYVDPAKQLPLPPNYGTWTWDKQFLAPRDSVPLRSPIDPYKLKMDGIVKAVERGETDSRSHLILVVYGQIQYTDGIAKENYKTPFCYRLERDLPSHMGGKLIPYYGPHQYSKYT
jgi:hypothetical protein